MEVRRRQIKNQQRTSTNSYELRLNILTVWRADMNPMQLLYYEKTNCRWTQIKCIG